MEKSPSTRRVQFADTEPEVFIVSRHQTASSGEEGKPTFRACRMLTIPQLCCVITWACLFVAYILVHALLGAALLLLCCDIP